MPMRIEDYALLGDMHTAALVARDGSIDWLCLPRFDSGACFAALLGDDGNGHWRIAPSGDRVAATRRRYRGDTLVLESEWETPSGTVRLVDFMPPRESLAGTVVRIVEGVSGAVDMAFELWLRFDYGHIVPWVRRVDRRIKAVAGPDVVWLSTPVELEGVEFQDAAEFTVRAGDRLPFILTWHPSYMPTPEAADPFEALDKTLDFWTEWSGRCTYTGEYRDAVMRSLITLKALIYAPTGGIVAAPSTSLPERFGGDRNWDYRYCWLRDATITLEALLRGGYVEEAVDWRIWLVRAVAGSPRDLQIMYGVAGERRLLEWEAEWLPGHEGSVPVRVGNAAAGQRQLDVYGEIVDAVYLALESGDRLRDHSVALVVALLDHLATCWREPDEGLWEVRGPRRYFVHSKVMVWVAFDRAVRMVEDHGQSGPVEFWRRIRDEIHADVLANGYDAKRNTFTQYYGSTELDAALLLIPAVGFLPPSDRRVTGTIDAVQRELMVDGFVLRYRTDVEAAADGLAGQEGVFLACSFWLADALRIVGRERESRDLLERLLALRNDVGLLSEEYDPRTRRQVGNFPQAFSHVPLINLAFDVSRHKEEYCRTPDDRATS